MLNESELREMVNLRAQEKLEEGKKEELVRKAWQLGLCPHCGSSSVEEVISYWSIWTKYTCKSCGNKYKYITPDSKGR